MIVVQGFLEGLKKPENNDKISLKLERSEEKKLLVVSSPIPPSTYFSRKNH
jgi:hypothetical protein